MAEQAIILPLFEDYPVTESLLVWYPVFIVAAELTLNIVRPNEDAKDSVFPLEVVWASTSFFLTVVGLETWHFKILYAMSPPSSNFFYHP